MNNYQYEDKKIVVVLAANVPSNIALNVIGHLCVSLGAYVDGSSLMGRPALKDKDGNSHKGIARYPIIITKLRPKKLKQFIKDVKGNCSELFIVDYPEDILTTGHDDELFKSLLLKSEEDITYLGALLFGDSKTVNDLTRKFTLWK